MPQVFQSEPKSGRRWPIARGLPLYLEVNLYTYVVRVNKTADFLWITSVYVGRSCTCRAHNRMHSLFARTEFR